MTIHGQGWPCAIRFPEQSNHSGETSAAAEHKEAECGNSRLRGTTGPTNGFKDSGRKFSQKENSPLRQNRQEQYGSRRICEHQGRGRRIVNGKVMGKIKGKNNPGCRQEDEYPGKHELSPNGSQLRCSRTSAVCKLRFGMCCACCLRQPGGNRQHGHRTERLGLHRLILSLKLCRHFVDV